MSGQIITPPNRQYGRHKLLGSMIDEINIYVLLTTIVPIAAYLIYIYIRDEYKKEPLIALLVAVMLGVFSAYALILGGVADKDAIGGSWYEKWHECWIDGFVLLAVPAELAKFVALSLFLFFNKYYDEYVDAVVYSVCVALGFIGIMNGWYLYYNEDNQLVRGLLSAFVLIPAHFTIGTVMGYFFALAKLRHKIYFYLLALFAAIVADGCFSSLLLWIDYQASLYVIAIIVLVILGVVMHGLTHGFGIEHLIISDSEKGKNND